MTKRYFPNTELVFGIHRTSPEEVPRLTREARSSVFFDKKNRYLTHLLTNKHNKDIASVNALLKQEEALEEALHLLPRDGQHDGALEQVACVLQVAYNVKRESHTWA